MKRFMNKKVAAIGLAAGLALGGAGIAFAYFTANGTGTGHATVGSASSWTFAQTSITGGPLLPEALGDGTTTETINFTVHNDGGVAQTLTDIQTAVDASVNSDQANSGYAACNVSDFSVGGEAIGTAHVDTTSSNLGVFAAGATKSFSVTVELVENGAVQNNCEGISVPLDFTANA